MNKFVVLFAACFLAACSHLDAPDASPAVCGSLNCMFAEAEMKLSATCRRDLVRYPRQRRAFIDAQYHYPLTNAATYNDWLGMGNRGPSPREWCEKYAVSRIRHAGPSHYAFN